VGLFKDALEVEAYLARLMQELLSICISLTKLVPEKGVKINLATFTKYNFQESKPFLAIIG
jgi:hypothetical protein